MTDQDDRWEQALASLSPEEREFGEHKATALLELAELLKDAERAAACASLIVGARSAALPSALRHRAEHPVRPLVP